MTLVLRLLVLQKEVLVRWVWGALPVSGQLAGEPGMVTFSLRSALSSLTELSTPKHPNGYLINSDVLLEV